MITPVRYPRTWHLPFSESISSDDNWHLNCDHFIGKEIVVTEKMDGECTSCYFDRIHARSLDSVSHPSQDWMRAYWGTFAYQIPKGWRICFENVYALHSIYYRNLTNYALVIGIYDDNNVCLSWKETIEYAQLMDLTLPPVIYQGPWNESLIRSLWTGSSAFETFSAESAKAAWREEHAIPLPVEKLVPTTGEGYVVRLADCFPYDDFARSVSKYVRSNHVQTSQYWKNEEIIPNGRKS